MSNQKYAYCVKMYAITSEGLVYIKNVEAYTSLKRAEHSAERLNTYADEDPEEGAVYYEADLND